MSPPEHYAEEAATLEREYLARARVERERPRLLDLGAGGGHVAVHLRERFECTAVDRSRAMLDNCARLAPEVERIEADLRRLRLDRRFEVALLHDAVDYMRSRDDLDQALATAAAHLEDEGIVFVAPTYTRESFVDGDLEHDRDDGGDVTYVSFVHDPDPDDTEYELILLYLLRDAHTRRVRSVEDRHRCGLFSEREWLSALSRAGFEAERVEDDKAWTLFAGRKRPTGRL